MRNNVISHRSGTRRSVHHWLHVFRLVTVTDQLGKRQTLLSSASGIAKKKSFQRRHFDYEFYSKLFFARSISAQSVSFQTCTVHVHVSQRQNSHYYFSKRQQHSTNLTILWNLYFDFFMSFGKSKGTEYHRKRPVSTICCQCTAAVSDVDHDISIKRQI